jgi:hypothetical protein
MSYRDSADDCRSDYVDQLASSSRISTVLKLKLLQRRYHTVWVYVENYELVGGWNCEGRSTFSTFVDVRFMTGGSDDH